MALMNTENANQGYRFNIYVYACRECPDSPKGNDAIEALQLRIHGEKFKAPKDMYETPR
jgi:hypothetical protein